MQIIMANNNQFNQIRYRLVRRKCRKQWRSFVWIFSSLMLAMLTIYSVVYGSNDQDIEWNNPNPHYRSRTLLTTSNNVSESSLSKDPKFPRDLFTDQQRRNGAVILHIIGLIYMFVALAIVCDEFFIPALDVITEKFDISEDVAGATFMAAGGSAPELFTSIIGVFISYDDVGIGTIVGSAVFNILFVLSMCAIFSKSVLELTWWPLFRDVSFYSLILITLVFCFKDSKIFWYEALILLIWYAAYVTFMKYNETLEQFATKLLTRGKVNKIDVPEAKDVMPSNYQHTRKMSTPLLHGGSKFRQGVLQLMIHSIDPLYEEPLSLAMKNGSTEITKDHIHPPGAAYCPVCGEEKHSLKLTNTNGVFHTAKALMANNNGNENGIPSEAAIMSTHATNDMSRTDSLTVDNTPEPLDISWPTLFRKQVTYLLLAPIIFPLWLTLPDVRRPEKRKYFAFAFIGSILWIAIYSYLMVWWATLVGETFRMPAEIMGLTFLAAGTSIPDLITSVLVARKGFGDMAVSSSVGSNIFDVAVGLPFPWLLYTILFGTVTVNSSGMVCSVVLLFIMLLFVILTIALFNWRLNISMALVMFVLYFIFIIFTLLLENKTINCAKIVAVF
ncbi:hypothetical protein RDWZM_006724 [Blomia tropicalis]|uniref:Sodium/calcium exchanger membrane region domain-containing protein n=1 Tax=Blomia tropicalis TaxID=40697 RepID=A0A9Q0M8C8_BLOTA|nr:hypothetical protein BLOT_012582 [Blomia tropicalis]KAJ6220912.1 hypothetical protein RDWZM_006724 [Blomia tropicalis]